MSQGSGRDYRETLNLPKTAFPMKADLPAREPDRVATTGVRFLDDQPAGGRRLVTEATGVAASVVNGVVATRDGESTGARPGRFLRATRSGPAPDPRS